jgi:Bax protein
MEEESARSLYDYKLANPVSKKFSEDWFELVSNDTVLDFLPSGFQKFSYGTSGLLKVPNLFVTIVPRGLDTLPVGDKKAIFIRFMLPLILNANQEIWDQRKILKIAKNTADYQTIINIAKMYQINTDAVNIDELLRLANERVLPVPTSLVLAQAAIESGWGTSRFSIQGNALFGQWSWSSESGLKPLEASNSKAVVRSFPDLQSSVTSYMKNLNTHFAYQEFRELRNSYISKGKWPNGLDLASAMHPYAEIGEHYVDSLKNIIMQNDLVRFDYSELVNLQEIACQASANVRFQLA